MEALRFDGALRYVADHAVPTLQGSDALIRVKLAGICSTDQAITQGYKGWNGVLGHEFVGVVEAVAEPAQAHWVGQRVVGEINVGCGDCPHCDAGLQNHCSGRSAMGIFGRDGAFATLCALPVRNLHAVPDSISDEAAVFTEPLAAALEVLEQLHVRPDSRAGVVGDGKLGLLVAQVLALAGADVALIGRHPERLALVTAQGIRAAKAHETFPLVVDCTGANSGFQTARTRLEPRGRLVLKSTHLSPPEVDWSRLMVDEIMLLGSRCGPFAPALRLLAAGRVNVNRLVEATYPLHQAVDAFATARGRLKVLLRPS